MGFQVVADYDAINEVLKKIKKTNADYKSLITSLNTEYTTMLDKDVWDGVDADTFRTNFETSYKQLKDLSDRYEEMASLIVEVSKRYQEADEQFSKIPISEYTPTGVYSEQLIGTSEYEDLYIHQYPIKYGSEYIHYAPIKIGSGDEYQIAIRNEDLVTGKIDSRWNGKVVSKKVSSSKGISAGGNES